jgi:hypothetical protein
MSFDNIKGANIKKSGDGYLFRFSYKPSNVVGRKNQVYTRQGSKDDMLSEIKTLEKDFENGSVKYSGGKKMLLNKLKKQVK